VTVTGHCVTQVSKDPDIFYNLVVKPNRYTKLHFSPAHLVRERCNSELCGLDLPLNLDERAHVRSAAAFKYVRFVGVEIRRSSFTPEGIRRKERFGNGHSVRQLL
jgi:hypothetical protein